MQKQTNVILEIDEMGNIHCLHTDKIDLFAIGKIVDVRKASNIEFCELKQCWQVTSLDGKILYEHQNRQAAIDWEIENFSPNGKYYDG